MNSQTFHDILAPWLAFVGLFAVVFLGVAVLAKRDGDRVRDAMDKAARD